MKTIKKASAGRESFAKKQPEKKEWTGKVFAAKAATPAAPASVKAELDISAIGRLANPAELKPELRIYHLKFGYGTIIRLDGTPADRKAVVLFDTLGEKVLLLKFAKLIIPKK